MIDMGFIKKSPLIFHRIGQVFAVVVFISLKLLFYDNMGMSNELDVLLLARQFADPTWISGDWYLNQPPGYRLLFAAIFGKLIVIWGFLATSIMGRLLCYGLVALGLVLIGPSLGLTLPLLLTALGLFLYGNPDQGIAAQEWLVGGLEAKSVAYGLVLLSIYYLLKQRYFAMTVLLGLATSFHVLVGGWVTLIFLAQMVLKRQIQIRKSGDIFRLSLIYLLFSCFAIPPTLSQLFSTQVSYDVSPSFIYVFLRLSHHLNPASWDPFWWLRWVGCLFCLLLSMEVLRRHRNDLPNPQYQAQVDLFQLTMLSLVPFVIGLVVTPFDSQGSWLQFYPFRVGDVLLPLNTCLLVACAVQGFMVQHRRSVHLICISLIAILCSLQFSDFRSQVTELNQFADRDPAFIALCDWVKAQTPTDAVIISPPVEFVEFSWLTERPTIAKYKLIPQTKARIVEWYERLADLGGGVFPHPNKSRGVRREIRQKLTKGYHRLDSRQVNYLFRKYSASYLMTSADHQLKLPIAYRNDRYILYAAFTSADT